MQPLMTPPPSALSMLGLRVFPGKAPDDPRVFAGFMKAEKLLYISSCCRKPLLGETTLRLDCTNAIESIARIPAVATRYAHTTVALRLIPW